MNVKRPTCRDGSEAELKQRPQPGPRRPPECTTNRRSALRAGNHRATTTPSGDGESPVFSFASSPPYSRSGATSDVGRAKNGFIDKLAYPPQNVRDSGRNGRA